MLKAMLTTVDNPHDPFTDFQSWLAFDMASGYDTPGHLARLVVIADETSEVVQQQAVNDAIDEIVQENILGVYRKVTREIP